MKRRRLLPLLAAPLLAQRGTNVGRRIPPTDEASRDPGVLAFRKTMLAAVARRDADWFRARLTAEPYSSFGGDRTPADFFAFWRLDTPGESPFWRELTRVLRMGGCFMNPALFASPYVYALFPNDIDAYEHDVVVKPGAVLLTEPNLKAPVVEVLRYDIVEIQAFNDDPWRFVRSASGKLGYVERSSLRSPNDNRALFEKVEGKWLLSAFIGGD